MNLRYEDDTIAAISTPVGVGGIGIIRISGSNAIAIADAVFHPKTGKRLSSALSHTIHYGHIYDQSGVEVIDEALVSVMKAPRTYTREDVVEINCHGGYQSLSRILKALIESGARLAEPGEFTQRAFLNGRIDLSQAEAVIDLIASKTDYARRLAIAQLEGSLQRNIDSLRESLIDAAALIEAQIDFPEEDLDEAGNMHVYELLQSNMANLDKLARSFESAHFFREGISAVIVGKPNAGKSSLLNTLIMKDRAIVTDIPGTTRDVIEEYLSIKGLPVKVLDTAGIREAHDSIEHEGIKRSMRAVESADLALAIFDLTVPIDEKDLELISMLEDKRTIIVLNKIDLVDEGLISDRIAYFKGMAVCAVSAKDGSGIEGLKDCIFSSCITECQDIVDSGCLITNQRHKDIIDSASGFLKQAIDSVDSRSPIEITAMFIREALDCLGQVTGAVTTEEIIHKIFSRFCIGK